jgi:hypothetical protein
MAVRISTAAAIAACNTLTSLIDAGSGVGTLVIYDGARPANVDTAVTTQTALVTFEFSDPAFANAVDANNAGHATANLIAAVQADETGTASWFRVYDSDDNPIYDGTVTDTNGNGDLKVSSTAIVQGIDVTVVSLTASMPKGA